MSGQEGYSTISSPPAMSRGGYVKEPPSVKSQRQQKQAEKRREKKNRCVLTENDRYNGVGRRDKMIIVQNQKHLEELKKRADNDAADEQEADELEEILYNVNPYCY